MAFISERNATARAYSVSELSEVVPGLNRTRVYEEIKSGRLRARKIGRRTIVLADELDEFLAALPESRT